VFPETRGERCWVHKIANVLDKLPKSLQPRVRVEREDGQVTVTRRRRATCR
jgi:putative transposase